MSISISDSCSGPLSGRRVEPEPFSWMMVRDAPAPPPTKMAVPTREVNICREMVEFAGRVTLIWFSKLEVETTGLTMEGTLFTPLITSRVPISRDAVVFTWYEI